MQKNILVLYYTQSGQLSEIVDCFIKPMIEAGLNVEKVLIRPEQDFIFPWNSDTFFNTMPESVLGVPVKLHPISLKQATYDLVVLAYQPWFLSPSIPITSALKDTTILNILHNTPTVTLIGARNMWLNSQEKIKHLLKDAHANLVGNIALVDKHNNHLSAVSILYWMLTGKKERYLSVFPTPGVAKKDIENASVFGSTVLQHITKGSWDGMQDTLVSLKAVDVKSNLMFIEQRAGKLFSIWANLIIGKTNRKPWVVGFKYYLLIALFIIAPIVITINEILFKPFLKKQIDKKRKYYQGLN